jgi:hypothetical protein
MHEVFSVVCLVISTFLIPVHSPVSKVKFEKIKKGMTADQVRRIMGCPPGYYCDREALLGHHVYLDVPHRKGRLGTVECWVGEEYFIVSYLGGEVVYKQTLESWTWRNERSVLQELRNRLFGRQSSRP